MKRILVMGLCLLLLTNSIGCSVFGGGSLDGTYKTNGLISNTFTFSGNDVVMSAFGISAEGKYRIDGNHIYINYNLWGKEYNIKYFFKREGRNLNIAGDIYYKQ